MKLVYGVGKNDANYTVTPKINGKQVMCPYYQTWIHMLERCYSKSWHKKHPTYSECLVAPEWHSFMSFKRWMKAQNWQGKQLDKDIIYPGNKNYSPETCAFINQKTNLMLNNRKTARREHPQGVHFNKIAKKFHAQINISGYNKYLGMFDTAEEASNVYRETKRLYILKTACCEPDVRVKQGLYRHSLLFQ